MKKGHISRGKNCGWGDGCPTIAAQAASRLRLTFRAATAATGTATRPLYRQVARFDRLGPAGKGHGTLR
jgi:hypothetical protein